MNRYELYLPPVIPEQKQAKAKPKAEPKPRKPHPRPLKGKKWEDYLSPETCARLRENLRRNLAKIHSKDKHPPTHRKAVAAVRDGHLVQTFPSAREAQRQWGIQAANIRNVCNGKRRTAGGYRWYNLDTNPWLLHLPKAD